MQATLARNYSNQKINYKKNVQVIHGKVKKELNRGTRMKK